MSKLILSPLERLMPEEFKNDLMYPVSSIFDDFFQKNSKISTLIDDQFFKNQSFPKINIIEENDKFVIEAGIPGMKKEDLNVSYDSLLYTLNISGRKSVNKDLSERNYIYKELKESKFSRTIQLSQNKNLDTKNISSKYDNGILQITIPKITPGLPDNLIQNINIE